MSVRGVGSAIRRIEGIYERRRQAALAISRQYALKAIAYFQKQQENNRYWINETDQAMNRMFTKAFLDLNSTGWFMAHGVDYGVYLELANNRKNQAIKPVIDTFKEAYLHDIQSLF